MVSDKVNESQKCVLYASKLQIREPANMWKMVNKNNKDRKLTCWCCIMSLFSCHHKKGYSYTLGEINGYFYVTEKQLF
jgi:hypothetical protein